MTHLRSNDLPLPSLAVNRVTVKYGINEVVKSVTLQFDGRRMHALLGPNGSGKSTLLKAIAGVVRTHSGTIRFDDGLSTDDASLGQLRNVRTNIRFVHQDLGLFNRLTVAENIVLGTSAARQGTFGLLGSKGLQESAQRAVRRLGVELPLNAVAGDLSPTDRVRVALARALLPLPNFGGFLFLDEFTASLDESDAASLLGQIRSLVDSSGLGVGFVTHRLHEVSEFADTTTLLRDGQVVYEADAAGLDLSTVRRALGATVTGADLDDANGRRSSRSLDDQPIVLQLSNASFAALQGVDLTIRRGEILGITSLAGSGRDSFASLLAGDCGIIAGSLKFQGSPRDSLARRALSRSGVGLVPADRLRNGSIASLTSLDNLILPKYGDFRRFRLFDAGAARRNAASLASELNIVPADLSVRFGTLSGGNQQKAIVGRWLDAGLVLLVVDEPTAGIDVGARELLYSRLRSEANRGAAVIVLTSDSAEAAVLCDRVLVFADNELSAELVGQDLTAENVAAATIAK